ncbi:hypothetical protein HPB49_010621 [Dermacentor silvarum]|uniref:Uncharacterized protein n=1 Tax=Dermacentor silvarum TaxID=543639 RepID=A0ACB8D538_DERSI|nr:hypothetical protein HPB49_010621 [Dermacentor silvarum]
MAYRSGRRQRIYEEYAEDSKSRRDNHWMMLLCLIGLLTVILTSILLTIFLLYKHSSDDTTDTAENSIRVSTISYAKYTKVPPTKQTSWQKAAGLFLVCVDFAKSYRKETGDLVAWMKSLRLDLANETRLARVDVVDMIVRCAIDFGIQVIFSITFDEKSFHNNKRAMQLDYSYEQDRWLLERQNIPESSNLLYYMQQLRWFNVDPSVEAPLAARIIEYEHESLRFPAFLLDTTRLHKYAGAFGKWIKVFSKYTNKTYRGKDNIVYKHYVLNVLVNLIRYPSVSLKGLRYLIAWSVFRQMVNYTDPKWLVGGRRVDHACYDHVLKVMKLAAVSPFLHSLVKPGMVREADRMVTKIRKVFRSALKSSSWITGEVRKVALRKLANLKQHVGSPGKRHDPAFVEKYYGRLLLAVTDCPTVLLLSTLSPRRRLAFFGTGYSIAVSASDSSLSLIMPSKWRKCRVVRKEYNKIMNELGLAQLVGLPCPTTKLQASPLPTVLV